MQKLTDKLTGQHALITGGGSGIGLAIAHALAQDGALITLVGRDREKLQRAAADVSAACSLDDQSAPCAISADVGVEAQIEAAIEQASERAPLTIVVANAGTGDIAPLIETDDAKWQSVLQTNLTGTFYTFKHAAKAIGRAGGGAMCAISSIAGVRTHRFMHAYGVSKAGIDMLVRSTADELGVSGIRVNSVCPGLVDTEIAQGLFDSEVVLQDYLDCMPLARTGVTADIANAVRFLCGPESSWITGVNLSVDGGHHLRRGPNYDSLVRSLFGDDVTDGKF